MVRRPSRSVKPAGGEVSPAHGEFWAVLGLGSNLGDRATRLARARAELLSGGFPWTLASSVWETQAEGGPAGQPPYLNQVVATPLARLALTPTRLLQLCQQVEARAGRRRIVHWGPRSLDIDILLLGNCIVCEPGLVVPHPRLLKRRFALGPLAEILPHVVPPGCDATVASLFATLLAQGPPAARPDALQLSPR